MKRIITLLSLAAALLLASACGQSGSADSGFTQDDLLLSINGTEYRCNMDIETVIADLGEEYEYTEGMSCDYDGLDKTFLYDVAEFYTNPLSEGDLISEIYTRSPQVTTSRGIAVGSTKAAVLSAYGEDYEDDNGLLIYRLEGDRVSLCFDIREDAVQAIFLTNQSV